MIRRGTVYLERGQPVKVLAQWRTAGHPTSREWEGRWPGVHIDRVSVEPEHEVVGKGADCRVIDVGERFIYGLGFGRATAPKVTVDPAVAARTTGPRNVLIQRRDGTLVVRPFRGLRKPSLSADQRAPADGLLGPESAR